MSGGSGARTGPAAASDSAGAGAGAAPVVVAAVRAHARRREAQTAQTAKGEEQCVKVRLLLGLRRALTCSDARTDHSRLVTTRNLPSGNSSAPRQLDSVLPGIDVLLRDSLHLDRGQAHRADHQSLGHRCAGRLHDRSPGARSAGTTWSRSSRRSTASAAWRRPASVVPTPWTRRPVSQSTASTARVERRRRAARRLGRAGRRSAGRRGAHLHLRVDDRARDRAAAAAAGKRVIVLDRPNPIGCAVQGPILDTAYASFIGMLPVPLRHGMTMGELARFANARLAIGADLVVVPVQGWRRCDWFDRTGLPWIRPSPNLPDLASVAWYPGTVLFEATNLSVGRGTDAPFRAGRRAVARRARRSCARWRVATTSPWTPCASRRARPATGSSTASRWPACASVPSTARAAIRCATP